MNKMVKPISQQTFLSTGFVPFTNTRFNDTAMLTKFHPLYEKSLDDDFVFRPEQLTESRDQGKCGSCWAFAITNSIADRIFIKQNLNVPLSPQNLLNCYGKNCDGADIDTVLSTLTTLIPEYQAPYKMVEDVKKSFGECITGSSNGYYVNVSPQSIHRLAGTGDDLIKNMKASIFHDGPIIGAMLAVYPDFAGYDGVSIYVPKADQESIGGHAIELIGWGVNDQGHKYWIARNSWGDTWPARELATEGKGWFYIEMGTNTCRIEEFAYACMPETKNDEKAQVTTITDTFDTNGSTTQYPQSPQDLQSQQNTQQPPPFVHTSYVIAFSIFIIVIPILALLLLAYLGGKASLHTGL